MFNEPETYAICGWPVDAHVTSQLNDAQSAEHTERGYRASSRSSLRIAPWGLDKPIPLRSINLHYFMARFNATLETQIKLYLLFCLTSNIGILHSIRQALYPRDLAADKLI